MKLIDLLPEYYKKSSYVIELQGAFQHWSDALIAARKDMFLQLNVQSATWGLNAWETALGLETDISKPYEYRRTRIMSKLRGSGTTTVAMIKNVAESFSNGAVDIIEANSDYKFVLKFTSVIGSPPNLDDIKAAIEEIKPAHLAMVYAFRYISNQEINNMTISVLNNTVLDKFASGG